MLVQISKNFENTEHIQNADEVLVLLGLKDIVHLLTGGELSRIDFCG